MSNEKTDVTNNPFHENEKAQVRITPLRFEDIPW